MKISRFDDRIFENSTSTPMSQQIRMSEFNYETTKLFVELASTADAFMHAANAGANLLEEAQPLIVNSESGGGFVWLLGETIIGFSQFTINFRRTVSAIHLFLLPEYRNAGLGSSCIAMLVTHIFENSPVLSITGALLPWNQRSLRMMLKNGFRETGYQKHSLWVQGDPILDKQTGAVMPSINVELTREQWLAAKQERKGADISYGISDKTLSILELERLRSQVSLSLKNDIQEISRLMKAQPVSLIADLGCGPGHYLASIADALPTLQFIGVDHHEPFLDFANAKYASSRIKFGSLDFIDETTLWPQADIYIMRFIFQHLSRDSIDKVLTNFKTKTPPNSLLYIVDIDDRTWITEPRCQAFHIAIGIRDDVQVLSHGDRQIGFKLPTIAKQNDLNVERFFLHAFNTFNVSASSLFEIVEPYVFQIRPDLNIVVPNSLRRMSREFLDWYSSKMQYFGGSLCCTVLSKGAK